MSRQQVQIGDLEPSTIVDNEAVPSSYAVQVRAVGPSGEYGSWSRELIFTALQPLPSELDDIVTTPEIDVVENDFLVYDGDSWVGRPVNDLVRRDGSLSFTGPVVGVEPLAQAHLATKQYVDDAVGRNIVFLSYDSSVSSVPLDFTKNTYIKHDISTDVEYLASTVVPGRTIKIFIQSTGNNAFTFPNWKFLTSKPSSIADGKTALLVIESFGTTPEESSASYVVHS